MKKTITIFAGLIIISVSIFAQQWVSTAPANKHAFIEAFTGVQCGGCPDGEAEVDQLLQLYGHQLASAGYHHPNTGFCVPYGNDEDFRRPFLAAYASAAFNFTGTYPTAFVNRRMWPGKTHRNIFRTDWQSKVQTILTEPSPLNIGLNPVYDPSTNILSIDIEVYFTNTVTDQLTVYVQFLESGMTTIQKVNLNYDSNYVHHHVFREAMCAQWGDPIATTTQGSLFTGSYSFDNSSNQYAMTSGEALVFVRNAATEEIITVERKMVSIVTNINEVNKRINSVYPNPFTQQTSLKLKHSSDDFIIFDLTGRDISANIKSTIIDDTTLNLDFTSVSGNSIYYLKSGGETIKLLVASH